MSKELATIQSGSALAITEDELIGVLQTSLYPGAALTSIKMVIAYCRAAGLDVMQKPVHIVPLWDGKTQSMRDVIMPGIGLYRTQASRSGQLAGVSEPEFGPMVEYELGGVKVVVPEFCRITAKRLMSNGSIAEFTAVEYWIENYAVKGGKEKSIAPNAMWAKRPRGQLVKCATSQSLRMAFPEMIGSAPTAEEMEGKQYAHQDEIDITPKEPQKHEISREEFALALDSIRSGDYDAVSMRGFYALTVDQEIVLADLEKELAK